MLLCPGPPLRDFDVDTIPKGMATMSTNLALTKHPLSHYWVFTEMSHIGICSPHYDPNTTKMIIPEAWSGASLDGDVYTMSSKHKPQGGLWSIAIAAMLGFKNIYIFGLDCFREEDNYYFLDYIRPPKLTENRLIGHERIYGRAGKRYYFTKGLRELTERIKEVLNSGIKINVYIVNSPWSKVDGVEHITTDEFKERARKEQRAGAAKLARAAKKTKKTEEAEEAQRLREEEEEEEGGEGGEEEEVALVDSEAEGTEMEHTYTEERNDHEPTGEDK